MPSIYPVRQGGFTPLPETDLFHQVCALPLYGLEERQHVFEVGPVNEEEHIGVLRTGPPCPIAVADHLLAHVVEDGVRALLDRSLPFIPEDVDIATSALPDEIRRLFRERPIVGVGEEFGVLVIAAPNGRKYEVATFRVEGEYDGRWPGRFTIRQFPRIPAIPRDRTASGVLL